MSDLSKSLDVLSPAKRALFEKLLSDRARQRRGTAARAGGISPRPAGLSTPPLSYAQQRLWFLDRLESGNPAYHIPIAVRLRGALDVRVLRASLLAVIGRHEALRTTFDEAAGQPFQVIHAEASLTWAEADLRMLGREAREEESRRSILAEARRPFDLRTGPLLRGLLLCMDDREHVLLLTIHHIVFDGWSISLLIRELDALYRAALAGEAPDLPQLPIQYADFALWQRRWEEGGGLDAQLAYWLRQLAGDDHLLPLPADRPRPPVQTHRGATCPGRLGPDLVRRLRRLAREEGTTLFVVILAAFQTLLHRLTGSPVIPVGTPIANRDQMETDGVIGFFVNTLVMRAEVSGDRSFRKMVVQVREIALGAYAHQDLPFEKLVEALQPRRDLSRPPLFQVLLAYRNTPKAAFSLPGLEVELVPIDDGVTQFDLTLSLSEDSDALPMDLIYNVDLFDPPTTGRLLGQFRSLLAAVSGPEDLPIGEIPLLTDAEVHQILREWNDTEAAYPGGGSLLHELFAAQVMRSPSRTALVFGGESLTYADLDARANCLHQHVAAQAARTPEAVAVELGDERWTYRRLVRSARRLARHLRELGVGPDVVVGLSAERSPAMVAGMLAVLEAGGAWLPLDPAYPAERLAFMLDDSGARVLLVQEHLLPLVPAAGRSVVLLDGRWDAGEKGEEPEGDLGVEVTPDHLAYVIYTSGSTGRPKGVMVPHRGVVNRLRWAQQIYQLGPSDAVLQKASFSFDFSVWECFAPLAAGARLVLAEPGRQGDGAYLVRTLREHRVTFVHFVPSMLAAFLGEEGVETCTSLRQVFSGGEALTPELRDRVLARLPAPLDNQYGPTEISIDTTRWVCAPGQDPHRVPIGRPIANSRLYVVDPELRPLPIDVAGELLVGGLGVTRGYLRMPALTAERFVPDPFAVEPGARLYRTGDLVRWTRAGHLEFLGRIDHQVKVRGFRIELGEIEAALACHPQVLESAVLLREDRPGDQRLVAYMVPVGSATVETAELRAFLRHSLPEFMVPATFVNLTSMPISPNGKVDRRALPQPVDGSERKGDYLAPRTPIEELLAGIWSDLLRVEEIGVNDDFFELGGHSLQGIRLVARIREVLGVDLPVRTLFQAPTLAALAASIADEMLWRAEQRSDAGGIATGQELTGDRLASVIAQLQEKQRSIGMTRIRPVEKREGPLPLSFAQERLWFLEQLEPGTAFYNIPGAVRIEGELRFEVLVASLEEVTRRHESLRTTFVELAGQPYQRVGPDSRLTVPIVDLTALPLPGRESELRQLATDESRRPFDLARGPLMRVVLLRLGTGDQVIVYTTHHIISDGWSALIFLREIATLYAALSTGRPASLPSLPVQYVDYAAWQRTYLAGSVLEAQLSYWRDRLAGAPGLELPTDRPRPAIESFRGGSHSVRLPQEIGRALLALSRREGATLFMTLLAIFKTLLLRYSGQTDLSVGSPIANRNRSEVERVIGFFANTVVLRTDLHGDPSFRELLMRVREVALGAYAHEDLPFERIVEELQPERDMSRNPLFQVMCVLQNQPQESLPAGDLRMSPLSIELAIAKFDLTLFWYEEQGWISGLLEYNTDLFDRSTALRFYQHYERLLEAVLANPGRPLLSLPLLGDAERHQIASEWSDTAAVAEDRCVHTWVEAQVERTPEAIAAVFGEQRLSFRELNLRANRLAHGLIRHGVGPESLVGICVDRSLEMVVAALAVLKAGGGLVALDPAYPRERLATIIEDAGLAILLTQEPLLRQFPRHRNIALCLAPGVEPFPLESGENPQIGLIPDHPMYVIYTSGSTGQPKGIVVTHRAFANLAFWQLGNSPLADGLRTVQFAAFGFCVSFQEIFSAWCSGGTLVVADEMIRRDPERLVELLASESIDRLHLPFAALKQLADVRETFARQPMRLTEIITAGEQLRVTPAVRDLLEQLPGCSLHNQYGASETHVVCELALRGNAAGWPAIPSVGRPIRNVRIHLLDSQLEPVPIGVSGDLYAAGACLARAYLNDPVLTAQKMVPDPFAKEPGSRLYRTGDLARHLCDGRIEFLGRADGQVKIRGFRVELGEVETALASHPRVRDAVAIAQPMEAAGLQLVAYVVAAEGDLAIEELRGYLKQRLPEYMIPSVFMQLEALPVTANGKLDQAALPVPEASGGPADYVAPRTLAEELLAGLWAELLGLERVGADDRFFDLGGHSLLATRVRSRVREAFGVKLPLRTFFERPKLADLAAQIEALQSADRAPQRMPIERADCRGPLPLSWNQRRFWFLHQLNPDSSAFNLSGAVRLSGSLDGAALEASFGEIVRRHSAVRTRIVAVAGVPHQIVDPPVDFVLPRIDLSGLGASARDRELRRVVESAANRPFDLTAEPPLHVLLLRLADHDHAVLFSLHHIAGDGWSMDILTRELGDLYAARIEGRPSPLPELPIQYADWVVAQQEWLRSPGGAEQLAYWRRKLRGDLPVLVLPMQRQRPLVRRFRGSSQSLILGAPLSSGLADLARSTGSTLFMGLLAAFKALLYQVTGSEDLLVGTNVANREWPGTEGLIGLFVNDLALRTDLSGRPSFRELLARVRETALDAYAHQDLPFEALQADLRPERAAGPLFQVLFVLQNAPVRAHELPGLTLAPFPGERRTANFDLSLTLAEGENGLEGAFVYDVDLFEDSTIARLAEDFVVLLREAVSDPDRPLSSLSSGFPAAAREIADSFSEEL